jgi:polar amino acid transport system substrate-binding protein
MGDQRKSVGVRARILTSVTIAALAAACGPSASESESPVTGEPAPSGEPSGTTYERILEEAHMTFGFANEPPFTIAQMEGVTGTDPETLYAIMRPLGVETFSGVLGEFAGLIPGLLAQRFDVIAAGMFVRPERCEEVDFANPNLVVREGLVVEEGNPLNLHSVDDIVANPDVLVGVTTGAVEFEYLDIAGVAPEQILGFPDVQTTFEALRTDRVHAVMMSVPVLAGNMAQDDSGLEYADPFEDPLDAEGNPVRSFTSIGFRPEDDDLREAFNAGLAELLESGELASIVEPFGFTAADLPAPDETAESICEP